MHNQLDFSFYRDKHVLVTGGLSFIGSALVDALSTAGALVYIVDNCSTGGQANLDGVNQANLIEVSYKDLMEYQSCLTAVEGIDVVFHLANVHGGRGFIDANQFKLTNNFVINQNMLRACKHHGVNRFIFASSGCVYAKAWQDMTSVDCKLPLIESLFDHTKPDLFDIDGMYGLSKAVGELMLKCSGLNGVSCRIFMAYGAKLPDSHALTALVNKAKAGIDPIEVWGDGTQIRNFTHVKDVVNGMLMAGIKITDCSAVNIGTDQGYTIKDTVKLINDIAGYTGGVVYDPSKPTGPLHRTCDVTKQRDVLGVIPSISLRSGLMDYFKA